MSILVNYATITNASTDVKSTAGRIKQQGRFTMQG